MRGPTQNARRPRPAPADGTAWAEVNTRSYDACLPFYQQVFGWDAQHERQIARLIDMGIDAVYSDFVDRMVAVAATFEADSRPAAGDDGD